MNLEDRIIAFIETLRVPDGTHVGERLVLRSWQRKIIREVYGPKRKDGRRAVRQALLSMGRKNGKTALVAGLCLAHLCGPAAVQNGQLYSLSVDREQAAVLFNYAAAIVYMDEELSGRLNVIESRKQIVDPVSGSRYVVLSGEKKGKMGKSSSFIAFDELAEFGSDRSLYDALLTSTAAHEEPMVWTFSTQAPDDVSVLSELVDYGEKVNRGEIEDPSFKGFLFTVPEDADPWDEENWYLANPALGDFRSLEEMRNFAAKAQRMPSMEASFRNLYLNQRVDGAAHFITPSVWKACGGEVDISVFDEELVYGGLDLSAKNDLTALVLVSKDADGVVHVMPFFWTPADNLKEREDRDRVPYSLWASQDFLTAVPGKTIDYRYVAQQVADLHGRMNISGLKFDRWRIDEFQRALQEEGVDAWVDGKDEPIPGGLRLVSHGQGYRDMNPAVETLEDLLAEGRMRHGMHPVLTMCASNTRVQSDPAGNRKFDKIKSTGRIDGVVAMAMAANGAIGGDAVAVSVYEDRGILVF